MSTSADYLSLRDYLEHPPLATVSSNELLESLHPHRPPSDPDFPAPTLLFEARMLLKRMPLAQQVVCAATAAELVLPLWESWVVAVEGQIPPHAAPYEAMKNLWRWLEGDASVAQLKSHAAAAEKASTHAEIASHGVLRGENTTDSAAAAFAAKHAADAIDFATYVAFGHFSDSAYLAMLAVDHAAQAVAFMAERRGDDHRLAWTLFIHRWWARCRCRLAFRDAVSASLE